jgi:membrane-associated protease RseP (regulator of RpoE activity)
MPMPESETLNSLVARVFRIEDVTLGEPARGLVARYRGQLLSGDSAAAYDQLAESLMPYDITPLFRVDKGQQVIYLVPKRPDPRPAQVAVNVILFILTVISVMMAGVNVPDSVPPKFWATLVYQMQHLLSGWPFALSLLGILLAHEFGHYFMSRIRHTPATLPYFIPLPLSPLGTMGAAILMRSTPKNKRVLFDIGVAGPLAGFVVAIPVLLFGLSISHLWVTPATTPQGEEGSSVLYLLAKYLVFGKLLPDPASTHGLALPLYWIKYFFSGSPYPVGATDVMLSPIAFAGWAGLLVTALNLIPAGTLDGGHLVYALFGNRAARAFPTIFLLLVALGLFWAGWWIWALLLLWLGRVHSEPLDQITELDPPRRLVALLVIVIFLLTFTPVPFTALLGPGQ